MPEAWTSYGARLKTTLNDLKEQNIEWTTNELATHLREYKRLGRDTIQKRLAQLAFMERHPVFPVQMHRGAWAFVNSFWLYVQHREKQEGCGPGALKNDHRAVRCLGQFLGIPGDVWPTAPTQPMTDEREIPAPERIHALLHTDYTASPRISYANHLVKGLLVFDFLVGARMPSEAFALRLADFDPARHRLVVTEPKKTGRRRTIHMVSIVRGKHGKPGRIEPHWYCCSTRHPSLANYLLWRKKVDPEGKQEAFFLRADGTPFPSKYALAKWLNEMVKPKFPWFHPYLGRHWSCNARLIDSSYDYSAVAKWHGHESVDMTRQEYEHNARMLEAEFGGNWLIRAGKALRKGR